MRPIDADALISEIKKDVEKAIEQDNKVEFFWLGYIAGLVIKQPTIQEEPQWIPCSERLPEAKQRVLVTFPDGTVDIKICIDAGHLKWFFAHMTAWMPLPEPYKEASE